MNECGFWFWFIKPFAEFAAAMSVIVGAIVVYAVWATYMAWSYERKKKGRK